jgi:hypothetical protein
MAHALYVKPSASKGSSALNPNVFCTERIGLTIKCRFSYQGLFPGSGIGDAIKIG